MRHINTSMLKALRNELKEVRGEMQGATEAFRVELQGNLSSLGEAHEKYMEYQGNIYIYNIIYIYICINVLGTDIQKP